MKNFLLILFAIVFLNSAFPQQVPDLPIPIGAADCVVWGDSLIFFGGSNNWGGTILYPRVYKFDGANWSYYDSIPDNSLFGVKTLLVEDSVYLLGGWRNGQKLIRKYYLKTKEWTYLTESPNLDQDYGLAAEYYNGNIYLFNFTGNVYEYNLAGNNWTEKTPQNFIADYNLSSVIYNNEVYLLGMIDTSFYKYSPSTDQWTRLSNSPYRAGNCSMGIINSLICCIGGNYFNNSAEYKSIMLYNPTTDSWSVDSFQISSKRHWMASTEYKGGFYVIGGFDSSGLGVSTVEQIVLGTTGVEDKTLHPTGFYLFQNYPNPFNPSTIISWQLPGRSHVSLKIYDILGNEVADLINENREPGYYETTFNASSLASGLYIYRLTATSGTGGNYISSRKMLMIK